MIKDNMKLRIFSILGLGLIISFISMFILFYGLAFTLNDVDGSMVGIDPFELEEMNEVRYPSSLKGFLHWSNEFFHGETILIETEKPIKVFSKGENIFSVGNIFFKTIGFTFLSLIAGIWISLLLNIKIIFNHNYLSRIAKGIDSLLSLVSGIHIMIIAFIILGVYDDHVPGVILAIIALLGSNVYYDISSLHHISLDRLKGADYILAAKAWGDSPFRHMRRSIGVMVLNQISTSWSQVLTNVIIIEILFQREGLGYELYKQVFEGSRSPDIGAILAISILAVLSIQLVSMVRQLSHIILLRIR